MNKKIKIDYQEFRLPYKCCFCDKLPFDKCKRCQKAFCRKHTAENLSSPKYKNLCLDCMIAIRDTLQKEIDYLLRLRESQTVENLNDMSLNFD